MMLKSTNGCYSRSSHTQMRLCTY